MRLVYNVYDDENQIASKQFDNFPKALEYAKQGLITYICEEDLDCPECEERIVWTWDCTWDDEEAISNVECKNSNEECKKHDIEHCEHCAEDYDDNIEITISGPTEEVKNLAELVFDSAFDLEWDSPVEETKAEEKDFSDEFGYEDEPAVKDLDFDVENPFEDDLYNLKRDLGEDDLEIGEPEIVVDQAKDSEEDQSKKLVEEAEEEIEKADEEEIEDETEEILTSVEEIKEIAAEAGEEVAEVVKENPEVEEEEIKEITDEVVEDKLEEQPEEELSDEEPEEVDEELHQKKSIPTYTLKELQSEIDRGEFTIDTEEERSEIIGLSGTEVRICPSINKDYEYEMYDILYDSDGEEVEGDTFEYFKDIVELANYLEDAGYIKVTDLDQYLEESYKVDLPQISVKEIKDELDLHGDIYFSLLEPVDESDEDRWREASEIRIVDTGSKYEVYFEWVDQDGDYIKSDPEFTCDTFEELLKEIDGSYVTVLDLEEYLNGTLDEVLDKEEKVELEEGRQPVYSIVIFYYYDKDNNENTTTKSNIVPKDIRAEIANLINHGATRVYVEAKINGEWDVLDKYTYDPEWTPGTPEYAARNSRDFALESLEQEDDLTDQEFAEQLQERLKKSNK